MCGRYSLTTPPELLVALYRLRARPGFAIEPRYNVAPTQSAPIVRAIRGSDEREIVSVRWGLIPAWTADPDAVSSAAPMINARCETADRKPAFREALRRRRCLVPTNGFYEWKSLGQVKQPYYVTTTDGSPFAYAGLWERWEPPSSSEGQPGGQEPIESFTILTTEPTDQLRELHDRMPVILGPDDWSRWLDPREDDPARLPGLGGPDRGLELSVHPVSRRVNRVVNDDPGCIERIEVEPPPPPEPTLF